MPSLADQRFVIFGCGYAGSALADAALARGAQVTALTRNAERAAALQARGIRVVVGDLAESSWHDAVASGAEVVVNTVSAAAPTPEGYRRSYVDGMRSILDWAARGPRPIGTFLYTSSTGVYPQGGGAVVDETAETGGASATGEILREAEEMLGGASAASVARWFILRLAGIYGPGRHHLLNALRSGTTRFSGSPGFRQNLVHRDDIVSAILACATAPAEIRNEVFNVSDDAPATRAELLNWLASRIGAPAPVIDAAAANPRRGGEPSPDRIIRAEKIRRLLGWTPVYGDFRAGYAAILREL